MNNKKKSKHYDIFISWSGNRSKAEAKALQWLLEEIFPGHNAFMSENDMRTGDYWDSIITSNIKKAKFILAILTPENIIKPWINFESGMACAISRSKPKLGTILAGSFIRNSSYLSIDKSPFQKLQHADLSKQIDINNLIKTIAERIDGNLLEIVEITDDQWTKYNKMRQQELKLASKDLMHDELPPLLKSLYEFSLGKGMEENGSEAVLSKILRRNRDVFLKEINELNEDGRWYALPIIYEQFSQSLELAGVYRCALEVAKICKTAAERADDNRIYKIMIRDMAWLYICLLKYDKADAILKDLETQFDKLDAEQRFFWFRYKGIINMYHNHDFKKAEKCFLNAEKMLEQISDENNRSDLSARIKQNFGKLALLNNQNTTAVDLFNCALSEFTKLNKFQYIAIASDKLAEALIEQYPENKDIYSLKEAQKLLDSALINSELSGWEEGIPRIYSTLGKLRKVLQDDEGAYNAFVESARLYTNLELEQKSSEANKYAMELKRNQKA